MLTDRLLQALARSLGVTRDSQLVAKPAPPLLDPVAADHLISDRIRQGSPCLIGRLGTPECNALLNSLEIEWSNSRRFARRLWARALGLRRSWDTNLLSMLHNNVGLFPPDTATAGRFCKVYAGALSELDCVGYWGIVPGEKYLLRKFAPKAQPFAASVLEPYLGHGKPWSCALAGKRVLVVHPFSDSVEKQYNRRDLLFPGTNLLPEFELRTLRAVQSLGGTQTPYHDWFEALDWMQGQMDLIEYDVCLVGAGAYSLPLGAHAKRSGKVAIYIGGALQILFGIKGKRWDGMPQISRFYNDAWVRPSENEKIAAGDRVEAGCYW